MGPNGKWGRLSRTKRASERDGYGARRKVESFGSSSPCFIVLCPSLLLFIKCVPFIRSFHPPPFSAIVMCYIVGFQDVIKCDFGDLSNFGCHSLRRPSQLVSEVG